MPEHSVPFSTPSAYTFSGNWALGGVDTIDFTAVPTVRAECTTDSLRLQGPDAPLASLWHRGS